MMSWIRARQITVVIALVGALLVGGATAVLAAQNYTNPGATRPLSSPLASTGTAKPQRTPESTAGHDQDNDQDDNGTEGEEQTLSGVIQSVNMDMHSFVLLPDGKQETLTIAFDTKTDMEQEQGASPLKSGAKVVAEVIKRADGSLYATEIKSSQKGEDDQGDNSGKDGHQDQSTPTPEGGEHD